MLGLSLMRLVNVKGTLNLTGAAGRETDTGVRSRNKNIGLALKSIWLSVETNMPSRQLQAPHRGVRGSMAVTDFSRLITGHGHLGGWET